jgi:hypothetical protein
MGARLLFVANAASGTRNRSPCAQPRSSRAVRAGEKSREESAAKRNGLRGVPLARTYRLAALSTAFSLRCGAALFVKATLPERPAPPEFSFRRTFLSRQPGSWQAVLVPPGGAPTPPRWLAANQPRRRRPFPATRTPREAPSMETTIRNIVLGVWKVKVRLSSRNSRNANIRDRERSGR